jgi:hypothetical protein
MDGRLNAGSAGHDVGLMGLAGRGELVGWGWLAERRAGAVGERALGRAGLGLRRG